MIKSAAVLLFMLSIGGVLSGARRDGDLLREERRGSRKCKNPTGNLWTSALKGCGQAVCKKKGSKAVWEVCPNPATKEDLQRVEDTLEDTLKKTEENVMASLKALEKKLENICDDQWYTTPAPQPTVISQGLKWTKIYAHDTEGGLFANLEDAKKKNVNDEEAKLFSRLYDLESMRDNDGVFHFRLCYPELSNKCNEWKQSSNPVVDSAVTDFVPISLTWPKNGNGGDFEGLMRSTPQYNLIDDSDYGTYWYNSVGTLQYWGGEKTIPGPGPDWGQAVTKKELYVYTEGDCPEGWLMFKGKCYRHPKDNKLSWADAESYCQSWSAGAHLASVHSAGEQKFVQNNFPQNIWLGGSDINKEGRWIWSDGTSWSFSDWIPGQPSNYGSGEDCLQGNAYNAEKNWRDLKWNDSPCRSEHLFLCKK